MTEKEEPKEKDGESKVRPRGSEAYYEGRKAHFDGSKERHNPYECDSGGNRIDWFNGFYDRGRQMKHGPNGDETIFYFADEPVITGKTK